MLTSITDDTTDGHPTPGDEAVPLARLVAGALKNTVKVLRKDDEARMSQITTALLDGLSKFREGEEKRTAQFEKAIASLNPTEHKPDPVTYFWTVYKKVADEYDNDLLSKYVGDLDTSLLFAGLFSAVTSAFIVQIIPQLQPNPADLTNVLLLQILRQNTSFGGADPLAPVSNIPISLVRAQSILFASLTITLLVAFIAVLGKQWILYYTRATGTTWGNIIYRGKERQVKFLGLRKWGLHLVMESLPIMLQLALLLFGIALTVYLWELDVTAAEVVLTVTSTGLLFYGCISIAATIWSDCPFKTPLSILLREVPGWAKKFTTLGRAWLRRKAAILLSRIERPKYTRLPDFLKRVIKTPSEPASPTPDEDVPKVGYQMTNPAFWRRDPLFKPPIPEDIGASAGFWLLENSTDFSAATSVTAIFHQFQWPSNHSSTTALVRLRYTYADCFRVPDPTRPTRIKALQISVAYYVLYHTQLIWNILGAGTGKIPADLLPDLFLGHHNEEWGREDLFEYLLHIDAEKRSEPVESARFLSYLAPYWFSGDSDDAIRFRPRRLRTLSELIEVLEQCMALEPATLTDCILCVGAVMDFPLHPEDLIRFDKSGYLASVLREVVEHLCQIAFSENRRKRYAEGALETLLSLIKKSVNAAWHYGQIYDPEKAASIDDPRKAGIDDLLKGMAWIDDLLKRAAWEWMDDDIFTVLLRLRTLKKTDGATTSPETTGEHDPDHFKRNKADPRGVATSENPTPEYALLHKVLRIVDIYGQQDDWEDDAVYGGLIAIRDLPGPELGDPKEELIWILSKTMEKRETEREVRNDKPFPVRKAAYDVVLAARDRWLWSADLRPTFEAVDLPRKLHSVIDGTFRSDFQRSFLEMIEILSEDKYWHPYLRKAMDLWLPFHRDGPDHALRTLCRVGELLLPERDGYNTEKSLEKVVEEEWKSVPGRSDPKDLTVDRLGPLAKVTEQFKRLSIFSESGRDGVLAEVEQVISSLKKRHDEGYGGPDDELQTIIEDLLGVLREPIQASSR